jgi:ABC-type lipoprotein export system ATPase subunit
VTPPSEPPSQGVPPSSSPPPPYISIVPPAPPPPPVVPPPDDTNGTNTENRRRRLLQELISKLNYDSSVLDSYLHSNKRALLQNSVGEPGPQTAPYCEISFKVMDPSVQVKCKAENCGIKLDNGDPIQCSSTTCVCPDSADCGGGGLTNTLVTSVTGASSLECAKPAAGQVLTSNDRQACTLRIGGLPVEAIAADCIIGDCQQPTGSSFNGSLADNTVENLYTNAVVAAIPAMILTFIVAVVGFYALSHKQLWSYAIGVEDMVALDKLAESNALPETMDHRVESLEFHNVSMWVPMSKKEATRKRHALYTKAVARTETASAPTPTANGATHLKKSGSGGNSNGHSNNNTGAGGFIKRAALQLHRRASGSEDVEATGDDVNVPKESKAAADYVCSLHNSTERPEQWYILRQCHGRVDSGQVVGVLGPSGGGKTSLLGAIAGSALDLGNTAVLTGKVYVDGRPRKNSDVAFVPQADLLIPSLTVAECLRYSAMLRLPANTPPLDLQLRIDLALDELGLKHVADSQVGGSGGIRGVSGGERRRVTIGMVSCYCCVPYCCFTHTHSLSLS